MGIVVLDLNSLETSNTLLYSLNNRTRQRHLQDFLVLVSEFLEYFGRNLSSLLTLANRLWTHVYIVIARLQSVNNDFHYLPILLF